MFYNKSSNLAIWSILGHRRYIKPLGKSGERFFNKSFSFSKIRGKKHEQIRGNKLFLLPCVRCVSQSRRLFYLGMSPGDILKVTTTALIHEMNLRQMETSNKIVPWFYENMPSSYFRQVDEELRKQHLTSQLTVKISHETDAENKEVTFLSVGEPKENGKAPTNGVGSLASQLASLDSPEGMHLNRVKVFSSEDRSIGINIFTFKADKAMKEAGYIINEGSAHWHPEYCAELFGEESMREYFAKVTPMYCQNSNPRRFLIQRKLYEEVCGTDGTRIHIEKSKKGSASSTKGTWITLYNLSIDRAHLDTVLDENQINDGQKSYVTMLRLLVEDHPILADDDALSNLSRHLLRGKWIDDDVLNLGLVRHPSLGVDRAEILHGIYTMLHSVVGVADPRSYSSVKSMHRMVESSEHMFALSSDIAQLFIDRFKPEELGGTMTEEDFQDKLFKLKEKINRYSFALRIHPQLLVPDNKPMPFGVFFACGRNFQFFHNRFRDISRGGLRVVTPPNTEQHGVESSRVFHECYGLSWAQQLKNKDIPEGGSKAVCLVNTPRLDSPQTRYQASRTAVRASVDAILDLICNDNSERIKDFYGREEVIFLGPDEQVVSSDSAWVCHRASQRKLAMPNSFMSSKADAGINHKEYGVTSEGIAVYLESALRHVRGINPRKDTFSVKITGGPDGDVAGNLIKILFRDFQSTARIVGVADGVGVAEDPHGLNASELLRLAKDEEGIARRNSMCFRLHADAFVPAGGRPSTINDKNWQKFMDEEGRPSSSLIVEGANIFITPEARDKLFQNGVTIVKDSSANKCGVVTSSCEVASSILLTTDEFLQHKDALVADVIERLHVLAKAEAELLFREYKNYPGALPHFSDRISNAINLVTDCIAEYLRDVDIDDPLIEELMPLVKENLPAKVSEIAWYRAKTAFPLQYIKNSIASTLASKMVYQEGIHLIEVQPENMLAERAIQYYRNNRAILELIMELEKGKKDGSRLSVATKSKVIALLKRGGTRSSCDFF
eukprot:GSChrysophyteH1.ASY1.ANO1.116.1 assembled CDS